MVKAPGIDNVYNVILKKTISTGFYNILARAFTGSLKLGFIPYVCKVAVLCMLIKPDKPPSQTTSYRPISFLSEIMKLFERVIEKRLRNTLKTMVSLASISQALGNPSQRMITFFVSLRPSWKASIEGNMLYRPSWMSKKHSTLFGTIDSRKKFTSLICPPSYVGGSLIF